MTPSDWLGIALRMLGLGCAVYPIVRWGVRPIIRHRLARRGRVAKSKLRQYRDAVRLSALLVGLALGLLPGVWEDWQPVVWRAVCGVVAGSLSVGLHHAVEAALPAAVARLLTGAGIASGMAEDTETGEFVTVPDSLDGRLADTDELHAVEWEE